GVEGLAWAYSIAYLVAALVAWRTLAKHVRGGLRAELLVPVIGRALVAAAAMGVALWLARDLVGSEDGWGAIVRLAFAGAAGLVVYFATLIGLGGMDARRRTLPWR
ncbi:MAG TPA: polysaccharide biosynthesis C-terminal domain-containing protein, partial [Acidimicrobiales bacterium]